jgi:acetylglutamate kinase
MVYAGGVNKDIVSRLQRKGLNTIGLCGADGRLIESHKRKPSPIDYGFVGDPYKVNTSLLETLANAGYTMVVAPITFDEECGLLNTNADTVAASVATALAASNEVELIFCFEKSGVLRDVDDESTLIETITREELVQLKADGVVADGMLPKLENSFKAIDGGVKRVVICSAENIANGRGTVLM